MAQGEAFEREELLAERITADETRLLLERLGSREFGGPEEATVGALIEATGADPVTVGSLLADIRREAFEARFDKTFGQHEKRIDRLEDTVYRAPEPVRQAPKVDLDSLSDRDKQKLADIVAEKRMEAQTRALVISMIVAFVVILIALPFLMTSAQKPPYVKATIEGSNGEMIEGMSNGTVRVRLPNGTFRAATADEEGRIIFFLADGPK